MKNLELLKFKLNQVLQANSTKRVKLATTGKIVPSRLAHYKTSKLLFSQPIPDTGKEYSCVFLLDLSGSMEGDKIRQAITVLKNLITLFYGIIDFKVTGFGLTVQDYSAREILSIDVNNGEHFNRLFNQRFDLLSIDGRDTFVHSEDGIKTMNWTTATTPALKTVADQIRKQSGEKFIVLLTDGGEGKSESRYGVNGIDSAEFNKTTHKQLANELISEGIDILPISIGGNYLSQYYDNSIVVNTSNVNEVYENTIKFIDKNFGQPISDNPVVEDYYDEDEDWEDDEDEDYNILFI